MSNSGSQNAPPGQPSMKAVQWFGKEDMRVVDCPKPVIMKPTDAIVKITTTTICGSDLHFYHNEMAGMHKKDIVGHEFMGIVEQVGPEVHDIKVGDRVVASCVVACGECFYCKNQLYSSCDTVNDEADAAMQEKLYGHRTGALFGYSHMLGGYDGGQAEFCRVPIADLNLLKVPDNLPDEKVILLSDVLCTAWHACELGEVEAGQTVAVWGLGPIGLMSLAWAKFRGAKRLIGIDNDAHRLELAQKKLGAEVIDFSKQDVHKTIKELVPMGPDVCIEASGFRFAKSLIHRFQRAVRMETDTPEQLYECISSVRKGGKVSVIADYYNVANAFPIGAFMEKGLTMKGGQVLVQKYWKKLLGYIQQGAIDPTFIISHVMPLDKATEAYRIFDRHEDNATKIMLKTPFGASLEGRSDALSNAIGTDVLGARKEQLASFQKNEGQIADR